VEILPTIGLLHEPGSAAPEHEKRDGGGWTRARALYSVLGTPSAEILTTVGLLPEPGRAAPRRSPTFLPRPKKPAEVGRSIEGSFSRER
jgi:hypothetical protein